MLNSTALLIGMWRATLALPDAQLPFNFEVKNQNNKTVIEIINGDERLLVDDIKVVDDSVFINMPVFGTEIRAYSLNGLMRGNFINNTRKIAKIPFEAHFGDSIRFNVSKEIIWAKKMAGRYAVKFSPGTKDSTFAVGLFEQNGKKATGTFLTTTGDYRYLEGVVEGDSLKLSCFDGMHLFLFLAKFTEGKLTGMYYSGNHWKENWIATRNDKAELPDLDKLTNLRKGYSSVDFSLPGLDSNIVTMHDDRFKGKVCVVQIMGSWCPNCMDETAFLSPFYDRYKSKGFEVVGLAFEKYPEFAKAKEGVMRIKNRFNIQYSLLVAGVASKDAVNKTLPMIENFLGYPTTIIIDKKGVVRKIHAGFSGPATGKYYERFTEEFESFIVNLINE